MELLQLKYFCHAAETENFSKTARIFMVPPSDISQSIKRLETEVGLPLFDRQANSIRLNDAGQIFLTHAKAALEHLRRAEEEIKGLMLPPRLRICIKVNRRIAMQAVEKFRRKYPETDMIVRHHADREDEPFDLIIDGADHAEEEYLAIELLSEEIVLAVKKDDPLAQRELLTADDLRDQPFITMNSGDNIHTITRQVCQSMGFTPRIALQSDDPFYIRQCVELGLGVAVIPALSWKGQFSGDIILKKLTDIRRKTYVCRQKERPSPAAEAFIRLLVTEFQDEKSAES